MSNFPNLPTIVMPCPEQPGQTCSILQEEFRQVVNDVREIKLAVVGKEEFGHRGLVSRVSTIERMVLILAGALILLGGERIVKFLL